jgi:digeranylgeranylglycerophospholipid reductase
MKIKKKYDALIIGAGPAGLMAARELMQNDINFMVIEAKREIGYPLKCAEITREETFIELYNRTDYPFIKNKIANFSFQIKDTQKQIKKNFLMLDKPMFQRWLAQPIEDNLMLNTEFEEIKKKDNFLEIVTNNGTFQTKLAILANGTNYKIQEEFGLTNKKVELVPCIGGLFKNKTLNPDTAYFYYDEDMYIASWAFPKANNIVNAGGGIILKHKKTENQNLAKAFEKSMKNFKIPLEGKHSFGGSYVTNGPVKQTYSDRLLVCGDSAGQVFAGIGEGIYFSLKAGQLAGQTAIRAIKNDTFNGDFLREYEIRWKKSFGRHMNAGVIFASVLFFLMRHHLAHKALQIIKPEEIHDIWINGIVSPRIKILYFLLKPFGYSPKR